MWRHAIYVLFGVLLCVPGGLSFAESHVPEPLYTNDNFNTIAHEKPDFFAADGSGGFYGYTETGRPFFQRNITNLYDIRLHRFEIDFAYFYISDKGVIHAEDDLAALSIYLTRA